MRRRHPLSSEECRRRLGRRGRPGGQARRGADRSTDVGDDHLEYLPRLDPILSRPAPADQPVGQRRPLGDAHTPVPAHCRVPLARGSHSPRHPRRSHRRNTEDARGLCHVRRRVDGPARGERREDSQRALCRRRRHVLHRSIDAGRQSPASRHVALPWTKLCQGL